MSSSTSAQLSEDQEKFFHREGYLVLPSFLEMDYDGRLIREVDELVIDRMNHDHRLIVSYSEMGLLTSHPPMMDKLEKLLGPKFTMHHVHSDRHNAGMEGSDWHQDYEQHPQTNRSHIMVHVFYYLNGLNGEIGDLMIVPRSQHVLVQRNLEIFGTEDLPGSICINDLPAGSAIILHSGIWHARRPKPGGDDNPRYFIDISYCQHGVIWPAYQESSTTETINAKAMEIGLDREGRYADLYDSSQFFDHNSIASKFSQVHQGSLMNYIFNGEQNARPPATHSGKSPSNRPWME